jgi:hypothetical protein
MIDLGQLEPSLRARPGPTPKSSWTVYLRRAAISMGYSTYHDVPIEREAELLALAHNLRNSSC